MIWLKAKAMAGRTSVGPESAAVCLRAFIADTHHGRNELKRENNPAPASSQE
jgi:hypothetical protein